MRFTSPLIISLAMLLTLSLGACDIDWAFDFDFDDFRYHFREHFSEDLEGVERVNITIVNGPIRVNTWGERNIDIDVDERVRARDQEMAEELADEVRLSSRRRGSELVIELDYGDLYHMRKYYYSGLEVRLPSDIALELNTTNGKIEIDAMNREVEAGTTNGSVHLESCRGGAKLSTTNGKIETGPVSGNLEAHTTNGSLSIRGVSGDIDAGTTNGGITLTDARGSSFRVRASTTNGRVSAYLEDSRFRGEYNRRHTFLEGAYGDGRYRVHLRTTNGGITIED